MLLTQSAYAKHRKVKKQTIHKYVKSGFINSALVFLPDRKKPLIDSVLADAILDADLHPAFTKRLNSDAKQSAKDAGFLSARAEAQCYHARLMRQKLEEKMKKYALKADVQNQIKIAFQIVKKSLDTIPARLAAVSEPKSKSDQKEIEKILSAEIKPILKEFFRQLNEI